MKAKVFGQKLQDKEYHDREAAYLVLVDDGLFALVKHVPESCFCREERLKRMSRKRNVL